MLTLTIPINIAIDVLFVLSSSAGSIEYSAWRIPDWDPRLLGSIQSIKQVVSVKAK